ncbi:MAG: hypothetical protein PVJ02_03805 [Gemmatimonadota bacterium]|jgi:hypothetical protein
MDSPAALRILPRALGSACWPVAIVGLLAGPLPARAQNPSNPDNPWVVTPEAVDFARNQPLFQSDAPLELTLSGPFTTIRKKDRDDDAEERPATLTFRKSDGTEVELEIKLETRGNWRREPRNCDFPPLWLDLDKDDPKLEGTVFEGQNRLKLYVTCRPGRDEYEQYILEEYLVYPTYNLLTDASFLARLAHVRYEDTDDPEESFASWAFILEHKYQMAARNEAVPLEAPAVHPRLMQPEKSTLEALFNYMVGMTDYSSVYRHNVEVIRTMDDQIIPVTYDFDWSGLVNTRYAVPDPKLDIRNVRERIYQGFCWDFDAEPVFQRFLDHQDQILSLWRDFSLIDEDRRKKAVSFLDDFFERIADPGRWRRVMRDCRDIPRD